VVVMAKLEGIYYPSLVRPRVSLFRYDYNGDELALWLATVLNSNLSAMASKKSDRNGDENGSKFRTVRYYVGTREDGREV